MEKEKIVEAATLPAAAYSGPVSAWNSISSNLATTLNLPNYLYEPCRCPEGARAAYLLQDLFLNPSPQIFSIVHEGIMYGGLAGGIAGAFIGATASKDKKGAVLGGLAGALTGSAVGSTATSLPLAASAAEFFGPWQGHGLEKILEAHSHGAGIVAL